MYTRSCERCTCKIAFLMVYICVMFKGSLTLAGLIFAFPPVKTMSSVLVNVTDLRLVCWLKSRDTVTEKIVHTASGCNLDFFRFHASE